MHLEFADFEKIDVRVGRVIRAEAFPEARKPAYKLTIDFGAEIGVKRSSAQLTRRYARRQVSGFKRYPGIEWADPGIGAGSVLD